MQNEPINMDSIANVIAFKNRSLTIVKSFICDFRINSCGVKIT
jgi:hypothetical protein